MNPPNRWACELTPSPNFTQQLNAGVFDDLSGTLPTVIRIGLRNLAMGARSQRWEGEAALELRNVPFRLSVLSPSTVDKLFLTLIDDDEDAHGAAILVDLLIAHRNPTFQIRRCFLDGVWFIPNSRSSVSKFCSSRCRNRFNYEANSLNVTFDCHNCARPLPIAEFSGLTGPHTFISPTSVKARQPWCTGCVKTTFPEWDTYLAAADDSKTGPKTRVNASAQTHTDTINNLIVECMRQHAEPAHYRAIADYVTMRAILRANPEKTILRYLLKHPDKFIAHPDQTFTLATHPGDVVL